MFKRGISLILALALVVSMVSRMPAFPLSGSMHLAGTRLTEEALATNPLGMQSKPILGPNESAEIKRETDSARAQPEGIQVASKGPSILIDIGASKNNPAAIGAMLLLKAEGFVVREINPHDKSIPWSDFKGTILFTT